jgi:rSAM/selenodomain-associated transferase 1
MLNKTLVIMFVKEPKLGFVKSRLAEHSSDEFTSILYQFFVHDLIYTLQGGTHDFKLCVFGDMEKINKTFGNFDNFLQTDGNLGTKMQNAFEEVFEKGYERVVLIGSDTPHLTNAILNQSFEKLENNDIVLGPSEDGGYYLIGFNKQTFNKDIFEDIAWSSPKVLKQTLQKLHEKDVYLNQELNDIDTMEDLKDFFDKFQKGYFENSYTIEFLKESKAQWLNLT